MRLAATILASVLTISAFSAHAAPQYVAPSTDYTTAAPGAYVVDPHHSSVTFRIAHMGLSNFTGRFNNVEGQLVLNPQKPEAVDMSARVQLANLDTANPELDSTLKGTGFFDAEHFADIRFTARKLQITGPTTGKLTADITLRGVTRPVVFNVQFHGHAKNYEGQETLGFSAHGTLKRSDFGMKAFIPMVGDEVELWLESELNKKS